MKKMLLKYKILNAIFIFTHVNQCLANKETFTETMELFPVNRDNQIYAVFNFTTLWENNNIHNNNHYRLFSRSVGELIKKYNVAEFHLTMTQGLWKPKVWGYAKYSSPPGAQLWVWFHQDTEDVDKMWYGFTNALSGLLCASLNFIKKTETVIPLYSFRPEGMLSNASSIYLRHAVLPKENLCTENLTPWLKLLPCSSHSGIASLLKPSRLHHTRFLSMGLHLKQLCPNSDPCSDTSLHLAQDISMVFDLKSGKNKKIKVINTADIFEKNLESYCPVSTASKIELNLPINDVSIIPEPTYSSSNIAMFDLLNSTNLKTVKVEWKKRSNQVNKVSPPVIMHCFLTGYGHKNRGIQCSVTNNGHEKFDVILMQTIPWFLQLYLHTLTLTVNNKEIIKPDVTYFKHSHIRERPTFMELIFSVQAQSTVDVYISFTRGFLTWLEYPPDAHHGFDVPAPVLTVSKSVLSNQRMDCNGDACRIYAEPMVIIIPTPDFSMPYNVICLACTVVAIAFGSLHNLTTRQFQKVDPESEKGKLKKLLNNIKDKFIKKKTENEKFKSDVAETKKETGGTDNKSKTK